MAGGLALANPPSRAGRDTAACPLRSATPATSAPGWGAGTWTAPAGAACAAVAAGAGRCAAAVRAVPGRLPPMVASPVLPVAPVRVAPWAVAVLEAPVAWRAARLAPVVPARAQAAARPGQQRQRRQTRCLRPGRARWSDGSAWFGSSKNAWWSRGARTRPRVARVGWGQGDHGRGQCPVTDRCTRGWESGFPACRKRLEAMPGTSGSRA